MNSAAEQLDLVARPEWDRGQAVPAPEEGRGGAPLDPEAKFMVWKQLPGARVIMERFYRITAGYFKRCQRRGIGVSQRLVEELVRDSIRVGELRGEAWDGYALNSHFTRPLVKHMIREHPEWARLFELRASNKAEMGKAES